jgi:hypothetical protein
MYTYLRQGYQLPTVGVLQVLLNRGISQNELVKDGIYGTKTKQAVRDFQRPRGLSPDGIVGKNTWPRLTAGTGFRIIDAVDITDPDTAITEVVDIRRTGGNPSIVGSMCNGIGQIVQALIGRMREQGEVALLRFHGHGAPGIMGISDGTGEYSYGDSDMSSLTAGVIATIASRLGMLRPYFGAYSSVELHGCKVARGTAGRQMIQRLANVWSVPVSGGVNTQYSGGTSTFRFEGPVFTAVPAGLTLKQWSKALPDLPKETVR